MTASLDRVAFRKIVRARSQLVLAHPFFGQLSLRMQPREDLACETAWADGRTLAYNPHYIRLLPEEKVRGLVGHVVLHTACGHHLRRKNRHPQWWNMACDYAINWMLLEAGFSLPEGYLDDPRLRGKSADDIYTRIFDGQSRNRSPDRHRQANEQDGFEPPRPEPDDETGESGGGAPQRTEELRKDLQRPRPPEAPDARTDRFEDKHQGQSDPGKTGEVRDAPLPEGSASGAEDNPSENEWRIALAQVVNQTKSMGDLPAGLSRLIHDLLHPKLDWRHLLGRFIQASARHDYAWMPPNRRYLHRGIFLPSMRSDDLPEMVVAVDTSGSITGAELDQFAAELSAILETSALTVHLLYCDTRVARAETIGRQDLPLALRPVGGGGTDYRPAFEWVAEQGILPRCMVYLTDLECTRYPSEPGYPVLWIHTVGMPVHPPFGEAIHLA